jgi:hypothetical protein
MRLRGTPDQYLSQPQFLLDLAARIDLYRSACIIDLAMVPATALPSSPIRLAVTPTSMVSDSP